MIRPKVIKEKSSLEYIEYLEAQLKMFTESPYADSYLSIKRFVDSGNKQIASKEIDLFTDEGQKDHKSISKFASQLKDLFAQMDFYRAKMNPSEQRRLDERLKENNLGVAERIALHSKK
jgi:hypothetical protein